jgi:hypothetical protein
MKRLLALAAVVILTGTASAQCPGGSCPLSAVRSLVSAPVRVMQAVARPTAVSVQNVRQVKVHRLAPLRTMLANHRNR